MSVCVVMNNNILVALMRIAAFLFIFALCYSLLLEFRFRSKKDLIISREFLDQLFTKSISLKDAGCGHNGDISIEGVTFEDEDFDVTEDIKALQESLHLLRNGGVTK